MESTALKIAACVCTYRRNEPLARLLERLAEIADRSADRFQLGVVVVDDNPGGDAEPVVESFADRFPLGVHYRRCGHQNISLARNAALQGGAELAEVVVMTDDDCVPDVEWIDALLDTREATGADSVSGPLLVMLPPGAPAWLQKQRVFDFDHEVIPDGAPLDTGQTNNCLIDTAWLAAHPEHRFDPEYGRIGGEDMVFFRGATALGMRSFHSERARVHQYEPIDEVTLWALMKSRFWWGNSEAVINLETSAASRPRLVVRGAKRCARALAMPLRRLVRRESPHVRVALIGVARGTGLVVGALGVRINHH